MVEIIGVKFKRNSKMYYFNPTGLKFELNDLVIVETVRGVEIGTVTMLNKMVPDDIISHQIKPIIRRATEKDMKINSDNERKEKEAFNIALEKIAELKLKMNLIDVEYTFDRSKILFYFTADGRVDFRELVKKLASVFRVRIELRQIGVRDETKYIGAIGICGREVCCKKYLGDFHPVTIKMAKDQNLSLNPLKISGVCSRLMCCLKYEQDNYEELLQHLPKQESIVSTADGKGTVMDVNVLSGIIKVKLDNEDNSLWKTYNASDVVIIKKAEPRLSREEMEKLKNLE